MSARDQAAAGDGHPGPLPLILGIYGTKASRRMTAHLRRTNPAGVLLLSRNIENPRQVSALIEDITQRLGRRIIVSIDHEGGWVVRFKSGIPAFPGNAALGRAGSASLARDVGRRMAEDLRKIGVTLNLAPVVDALAGGYNPGILIRSFGRDANLCSRLGAAFVKGLQDNGVWACAKHFPGKGAAKKDAHYALPVINATRAQISRDLKPFKAAIKAGVSCVMSSHLLIPALDSQPATFSEPVIRGLLRRKMGYSGVIISDDLGMGGATATRGIPRAAKDALDAGHDLLIIAHDVREQVRAAEAVEETLSQSQARVEALESARRFEILSRAPRVLSKKSDPAAGRTDLDLLIARKAAAVVRSGGQKFPWTIATGPALVILPDFKEVDDLFCFEDGPGGAERFVRKLLGGRVDYILARAPVRSKNPSALAELKSKFDRTRSAIFFCFEAMRFPGQRTALDMLRRAGPNKSAVCLIRNSWDLDLTPPKAAVVDAFGFRHCQLRAALELIFGRGRLS